MPIENRKNIIRILEESVRRDEALQTASARIAQLIPVAEEVFGVTYNQGRKENGDTLVRNVCAVAMTSEWYTFTAVAKAMNRHRSSVYMMLQRAKEMRDGFFGKDIQDKYNAFINRV